MADVNANIGVNIDTSQALAQLKALQRQISQFHTSIARSSESAALAQRSLQKNLIGSINAIGAFSAELRTVRTSAETFTNSLEKNKFSMREYFRYAGASTKTFGKLFKSEFDTIGKVAEERVKTLQTQYIKLGRNASGAMEAIAVRPTALNMQDYGTRTAIAAQKQALFNQLMKQGTTNLLNFGKNTQWAGRQLMVGFTIPLSIVGSAATKTFMEMEAQTLKFRKVYGDLFTPRAETQAALDSIIELGRQFTKYGVAVSQTVALSAEAAAAGFQGLDLQRQTTEATRLSVLGQIDSQKALETTISLQNAFGMSSENLADSINFLNAVENQTVVSLDDITTAIPKVAPVIQQLGGDVKDLTFFIAAMKEGGINASEGANALKSGLAALINPTEKASNMLKGFGINATAIIEKNKGNLKATVIEFANALNTLDPLARARAIEQMFGKFQFARLSTLFANVARDGNQAARVLDLANASVEELSALSEQELGMTADSAMNKFKKSVEDLKLALVPVGQAFLEAATPIVEFVGGVLEKFGNLSDGTKRLITLLTVGIGAVGPIFLMTFGLLANGLANALKGAMILRQGYLRLTGQSQVLGEQTQYLNSEQLEAAAAAHSLDQTHAKLTQTFNVEAQALQRLIAAYQSAGRAAQTFAFNNPGMMMPRRGPKKLASGIVSVPGPKGAGDIVPAMLSPGEAVIPSKMAQKYAPLINGMIANNIPGFRKGLPLGDIKKSLGLFRAPYAVAKQTGAMSWETLPEELVAVEQAASEILNKTVSDVQKINEKLGNLKRKQASHIVPDVTSMMVGEEAVNIKNWKASNLQADIGYVNAYVNTIQQSNSIVENFNKQHIDQAAKTLNISVDEVAEELNKLKQGIHPTTRKSASVLRQVAMTDPSYQGQAAAAGLGVRLSGDYYETLGSRSYDPAKDISSARTVQRKVEKLEKQVIARSQSLAQAAISKTAQAAGTSSPSKKTIQIGQDIARGLEIGMQNRRQNVAQAGANLSGAAIAGVRNVPFQAPGQAATIPQIAANMPVSPSILGGINEPSRIRRFGSGRALMGIGTASMAASMLPGKAGDIGMKIGGLAFVAQALMMLPGPLKLVAVAFGGLYTISNLLKKAKEEERRKIISFGDSLTTTKKQLESTGDYFGVSVKKSRLETAGGVVAATRASTSLRGKIDEFKSSDVFQKDYASAVKSLREQTNADAKTALLIRAQTLLAQGYSEEQINIIISSLQEAAGKQDLNLIFKNIKLEALNKDILEGLKPKLAELDLVKNKFKEITKYQTITSGRAVTVIPSKEIVATEEFKNKITNAGMAVQEFIKNIDILREQGGMSVKDVEKSFNGLMYTIKTMAPDIATQGLLMKEAFKGLDSDIAKAATAIKDVEKQTLLLEAAMYGAVIPVAMLNAYTQNTGSGLYSEGELKGDIERLIKFAKEVTDKKYKIAQDALKTGTQGEKLTYEKSYSIISNFFNTQEALIKQQRKSEADLLQTKIDNAQAAVDAAEKEIDAKQKIIDTTQREIDLLNRRIELEFDRPIQKLQDESTILNNNLEIIRRQEDAINNQYDKQIQALEKISSVNQEIANQEKSRLNIASALTSGDVAAAAQAVQEARAQAAASQIEKQRTAIEASRQQAISAVSVGGMTKDQIEARTYQISQQVFTLEQQRKTLQAEIVILQDKNYIVEQQIYDIKQKSVIPNQQIVDSTKLALDQYNKQTESLFNNLTYLGKTKTQWEETNTKIEAANATLATQELSLKKINTLVSEIQNKYAKMSSAPGINPFSTPTIIPTTYGSAYGAFSELYRAKMYGGKILPMNMGGIVPKYFARGGRMGSDTVPAMLTPGEFVMNKKATKEFGPLLSMLNESKYPSMIGPSYSSEKVSPNKTSINNNSRNVYNYNVGINVGGTNASANNIAKAVMDEIKYLDAQRIRGQRAI